MSFLYGCYFMPDCIKIQVHITEYIYFILDLIFKM